MRPVLLFTQMDFSLMRYGQQDKEQRFTLYVSGSKSSYMKGILFSIIFGGLNLFLPACKKDNSTSLTSIAGSWELSREQSGMTPAINYSSGNGNILKFTDSEFQIFSNGQPVKRGEYTLVKVSSVATETCLVVPTDQYRNRIVYDNKHFEPKVFVQISDTSLVFLSGCFALDYGSYKEYLRQ